MAMKIVAVANQKGGVGKTTATVNLAAALAKMARRVLVVDNDPQCNLTMAFGLDPKTVKAGTDSLYEGKAPQIYSAGSLSVIAAGVNFVATGLDLARRFPAFPSGVLRQRLAPIATGYDYVLIDCGPSLDMLLLNALVASGYVLAPTLCHDMSTTMLAGFEQTISDIKEINPGIKLLGVLPMAYAAGEKHDRNQLAGLTEKYGNLCFAPIPRRAEYKTATEEHRPVNGDQSLLWAALATEVERRCNLG